MHSRVSDPCHHSSNVKWPVYALTGQRLNILLLSIIGIFLDNDIPKPLHCHFGITIGQFALHYIILPNGRLPRHLALNNIIKQGLGAAGVALLLVTANLDQRDLAFR